MSAGLSCGLQSVASFLHPSFGKQRDTWFAGGAAFQNVIAQSRRFVFARKQHVIKSPGFQHRLSKMFGRVGRVGNQVTTMADDREQRQTQIEQKIPQGVAGIEHASGLHHDDWPRAAEMQPRGQPPGFAFAAYAQQAKRLRRIEHRLPSAQPGIRQPHDVRVAQISQQVGDFSTR